MSAADRTILFLLLAVCGCLLYLDWKRQGEIEDVYIRVENLAAAVRDQKAPARPARKPKPPEGTS